MATVSDPGFPWPKAIAQLHVPLSTLCEHREELRGRIHDDVVLICRSGMRAEQAERSLAEVGMPGVHVLDGGMNAWQAASGHVLRGRSRWELERQVRLVSGSLVLVGVLAGLLYQPLTWIAGVIGAGICDARTLDDHRAEDTRG